MPKKRTTEEMREYQRKRRARLRGVTPEEQGVTPPDKTRTQDTLDTSYPDQDRVTPPPIDWEEPF